MFHRADVMHEKNMYYLGGYLVSDNDFALAAMLWPCITIWSVTFPNRRGKSYLSSRCSPDSQVHSPASITARIRAGNCRPFLMRSEWERRNNISRQLAHESTDLALLMQLREVEACTSYSLLRLCPSAGERRLGVMPWEFNSTPYLKDRSKSAAV